MARQENVHTITFVFIYAYIQSIKRCKHNVCHANAVRLLDCAGKTVS